MKVALNSSIFDAAKVNEAKKLFIGDESFDVTFILILKPFTTSCSFHALTINF